MRIFIYLSFTEITPNFQLSECYYIGSNEIIPFVGLFKMKTVILV